MIATVLASLPSPPGKSISIGPLELRAYGLAIALGVVAAVTVAQRRWRRAGGDPADIASLATWAVPAGLLGARAYHVLTDWQKFRGRWPDVFAIWQGGLGIPGGLITGVAVGAWIAHRRGIPVSRLLDAVAPAIPLAQAIGRLGNWFNQELFGRPTNLPWGLEIDADQRPDRFLTEDTFHPTFLYEAMWNLALAGLLVWIGRRFRLRQGQLFTLYVAGYSLGRLWIEALRIDPASQLLGLRVNIWTSTVTIAVATVIFLVRRADWSHGPQDPARSHSG